MMPRARHAVRQPARVINALQPRQQDDRADADAGEGEAHGEASAANEPVGQEQPLACVAKADAAAADQHAERGVELPRLVHQRGQQQSDSDQDNAQLVDHQRAAPVHQPAKKTGSGRRRR